MGNWVEDVLGFHAKDPTEAKVTILSPRSVVGMRAPAGNRFPNQAVIALAAGTLNHLLRFYDLRHSLQNVQAKGIF